MTKYVSVYSAHGPIEAESIRSFLESFGIEAVLSNEPGMTFSFTIGPLDVTGVLVPEDQEEKAKIILKEMRDGTYEDEEGSSGVV